VDKYKLDIFYTLHFPQDVKYISLYSKTDSTSQETGVKREEIKEKMREMMARNRPSGGNMVEVAVPVKGKEKRNKGNV
jgi:hypothetical protein